MTPAVLEPRGADLRSAGPDGLRPALHRARGPAHRQTRGLPHWLSVLCLLSSVLFLQAAPFTNATFRARLEWDAATDPIVTGYFAYCSTSSFWHGTNQVLNPVLVTRVDAGTNVTCDVTNLLPGVRYYFVVTCYNAECIESDYSNELQLSVSKPPAPPHVRVKLTLALERSNSADGPWSPEANAPEYAVQLDGEGAAFWRVRLEAR
jgi:hypothetical protein